MHAGQGELKVKRKKSDLAWKQKPGSSVLRLFALKRLNLVFVGN